MNWTSVMGSVGGVAGAVAAVVTGLVSYRLNMKLQALKKDQEIQAANLRMDHERALKKMEIKANERIERMKLGKDTFDRWGEAYSELLPITGALNLFGPTYPVDVAKVSECLTSWYGSNGEILTSESKRRYFLLQEVLNFFQLRKFAPVRPSDELLFGGEKRPVEAIRAYRAVRLEIPGRGDEGSSAFEDLETYVRRFKTKCNQSPEKVSPEDAWLLLQFVMSAFRSYIIREFGSRDVVHSSPMTEADEAGGGL